MGAPIAIGLGVIAGGAAAYLLARALLGTELTTLGELSRLGGAIGGVLGRGGDGGGSGITIKVGVVVVGGLLAAALVARMV